MGKFKKGVRVRLIEDHDRRASAGMIGTIVGKDEDGDRDVIFDDFTKGHSGLANDDSTNHWFVPKSKLEVVADKPPTKRFNIGDRATALDGEQVTIDSEVDDIDHVWVVNAEGNRWRAPTSWFTEAWVPKVGDRVRMAESSIWYCEDTMTVGTVVGPHPTPDCFYVRFDGDTFDWYVGVGDIYLVEKPLPVAAEAQPAGLQIEAGKFYRTRDGRKVGPMEKRETGWSEYTFEVEGGRYIFKPDGTNYDGPGCPLDLVAEWVDELVSPATQPANDNVSVHTLTLTLNSEPLADAFRTIAAALNQAADSIGKAA